MKFAVLLTSLMLMHAAGDAGAWPTRPVRVIATSPPGGSVDLLARIAADEFAALLRAEYAKYGEIVKAVGAKID